jgi:outer membrane protein OmpA-like peptidoglycan-associated protein
MVRFIRPAALPLLGALLVLALPASASAQFGRRLKDAVVHNAENRAISEVIQQQNKAIDAALSADLTSDDDVAGGKLYEELSSAGRLTVDGVAFEEGTATMTDGSAASLKAIGSMLKAHADLAVRLEAYAADKTVALARADAVKQSLVKAYAIADNRIETGGYLVKGGDRMDLVQR